MVTDLAFPIQILGGSIVREADGLAMSSRNQYLSAQERPRAAEIRRTLQQMRQAMLAGTARAEVEAAARAHLTAAGFQVDYAVVRRPDLSEPGPADTGARVALIAARLGRTRLIDNLEF
jgi:pantoate--beta-alanine ligase